MVSATVAIIGVGRMGSAIARRLRGKGYGIILWNRTVEKAKRLASELEASLARDPFEAVQHAQYAILALADDDAVYSVVGRFHRLDGLIVINTSTITPQTSRRTSGYLEGMGACYVEAPIVGGPRAVEAGEAIGIVAGRRTCISLADGLLRDLFSETIYVGDDTEAAAALKLSFNLLLISSIEALAEAMALSEAYGVDTGKLRDLLSKTVFAAFAAKYIERMMREPSGRASFTLELAEKDLEYAARAAYHAGLPAPGTLGAKTAYSYAKMLGLGGEDYTKVYHALHSTRRA